MSDEGGHYSEKTKKQELRTNNSISAHFSKYLLNAHGLTMRLLSGVRESHELKERKHGLKFNFFGFCVAVVKIKWNNSCESIWLIKCSFILHITRAGVIMSNQYE